MVKVTLRFVQLVCWFGCLAVPNVALSEIDEDIPPCDRKAFGRYTQVDYMDTRARMLVTHAIGPVDIVSNASGKKRVSQGSWEDPYTGYTFWNVDARKVEIDHVIPVCWAWKHGAYAWPREKRRAFFNDEAYLAVVEAGLNRSKGMQGPDSFLPRQRDFACRYVHTFLDGVAEYGLILSYSQQAELISIRTRACQDLLPDSQITAGY